MAYSADSFVADEIPTTTKWNKLWNNDASFNDGSGIGDNVILDRHIATGNLKTNKVSNPYKFSVYRNAAQNTISGGFGKVNFDTEYFDTGSNYDNVTNYRFVAPVAGFYQFNASVSTNSGVTLWALAFYKNGGEFSRGGKHNPGGASIGTSHADLIQLAASDYIEVYQYSSTVVALEVGASAPHATFSGFLDSTT